MQKKKNLVFFMTDQQRFDTLNMNVGGVDVAPTWSKMAKDSAFFERAYDTCPLCVPSRTSLSTGINPIKNGMMLNDLKGVYAKDNKPIHEMLFESGYEVAHVGVNHISLMPKLEDRIPYTTFLTDADYNAYATAKGIDVSRQEYQCDIVKENCEGLYIDRPYSNTKVAIWHHEIKDFKDVWFADNAIDFINGKHDKPFALFVCFWAPHPPLTVPQEYLDLFPPENFTLPETTGRPNKDELRSYSTGSPRQLANNPPTKGWKEGWSAHAALTRLCDDQLKRIINALKDNGVYDDTFLVCTTDHGEQMGEHNMYQKMEMYESAVRVPAIFKVPGCSPHTFKTDITHLDFVPTILDYLLEQDVSGFEGISLMNSIRTGEEPPKRDIFSVYNGNHKYGDTRRMIVSYPYKLIYDGKDCELFNLEKDPKETINLKDIEPEVKQSLLLRLKAWSEKNGDPLVKYEGV